MRNLILSTVLLTFFIRFCEAGQEKRPATEFTSDEASSSDQKKRRESTSTQLGLSLQAPISDETVDFLNGALIKLDEIEKFRSPCTKKSLIELKIKLDTNQTTLDQVHTLIYQCRRQFSEWYSNRIARLDFMAQSIDIWIQAARKFMYSRTNYIEAIATKPFRGSKQGKQFYDQIRKKDRNEYVRRAYSNGEGVCNFFFLPPFHLIEEYLETILNEFKDIIPIKDLRENMTLSLELFLSQKICRRLYEDPSNTLDSDTVLSINTNSKEVLTLNYQHAYRKLNVEARKYKCEWITVRKFRELHRIFNLLKNRTQIVEGNKEEIDKLTDSFVEHCLEKITARFESVKKLYNVDHSLGILFQKESQQIGQIIRSFDMPQDSVNDILDIRDDRNVFRDLFFSRIKLKIGVSNDIHTVNLYIQLLNIDRESFERLFNEPIYAQKSVASQSLEFLTDVFSINGYRPKISHSLLDFYYFYRIAEMAQLMPIVINPSSNVCNINLLKIKSISSV